MALKYHEVVETLQGYEGAEHSTDAQQYLNSIAGETVEVPGGGPTIPAPQALHFYNKYAEMKAVRDAREENPPRKLTREDTRAAYVPEPLATTAAGILTDLEALDGQALADYKSRLGGTTMTLYDLYGNAVTVRAADALRYTAKGFPAAYPTVAVTGTAIASGVAEAEIVSGNETLIFTLTNGTWAAAGATFNALRASFLAYLRAGGAEVAGWDAEVVPELAVDNVVRTSDTVVTITLPAAADYAIAADEDVALGVPAGAVVTDEDGTLRVAVTPTPAEFTITAA